MDSISNSSAASASASTIPSISAPQPPFRKTRSACNRCHSQKLKCVKASGQLSCERCLRLKTGCRFGPRVTRASQKPLEQVTNLLQHDWNESSSISTFAPMPILQSNEMILDMDDADWLSFPNANIGNMERQANIYPDLCFPLQSSLPNDTDLDWTGLFPNMDFFNHDKTVTTDHIHTNYNITNESSSDYAMRIENNDTSDNLEISPPSITQKIANLNVALYECAAKLPSMNEAGVVSPSIASKEVNSSQKTTLFAIDKLFNLTAEFTKIMECFSFQVRSTSIGTSSIDLVDLDKTYSVLSPTDSIIEKIIDPPSNPPSNVDEATILLLASTHTRLTSIYNSIFHMMHACIEFKVIPQLGPNWAIVLPQLQVGSHASPPVHIAIDKPISLETSSMYMVMMTMLSSQLWEQLADVLGRVGVVESISLVADMVWAAVMEKTRKVLGSIDTVKELLRR